MVPSTPVISANLSEPDAEPLAATARQAVCSDHEVVGGLVDGDRVVGGEHSDVRHDRSIREAPTVAVRGDVRDEREIDDLALLLGDGAGHVLDDLLLQGVGARLPLCGDCAVRAASDTLPAAVADVEVDDCEAVRPDGDRRDRARLDATVARGALLGRHLGLEVRVHALLRTAASEPHAHVLERAAEPGGLVSLHVGDDDHRVGVHRSCADTHALEMSESLDGYVDGVTAVQPVSDDDGRLDRRVREPMPHRAGEMVHGVASLAGVERVGVGQKWIAACLLDAVDNLPREDGVHEAGIALLAEVQLDRHQIAVGDRVLESRALEQLPHALDQRFLLDAAYRCEPDGRLALSGRDCIAHWLIRS